MAVTALPQAVIVNTLPPTLGGTQTLVTQALVRRLMTYKQRRAARAFIRSGSHRIRAHVL